MNDHLPTNTSEDDLPTRDSALAFEVPTGLSPAAVAARKAALVAAGTPAIYAEKFAIDAEQQQEWHDNPKLREGTQASPKTEAEHVAQTIRDAQKVGEEAETGKRGGK